MTAAQSGYLLLQGDAGRIPLENESVSLCFGSPPYCDCRTYLEDGRDLGIARGLDEWVEWMLAVTTEALRVTRGAVVWVASGKTEGRNYWPAPEGLMWEWHRRGGHAYRPVYWHRSGIPGNGGDDWFRADVEYAMCFKRPGKLAWADNTAMGHPPRYNNVEGRPSRRLVDGELVNTYKRGRRANGLKIDAEPSGGASGTTISVELANPGNLLSTGAVGGGHLGHPAAHLSEAPFPEDLAEFFIRSLCPPGGTVLDPFSGSGTTASVALRCGRNAIGMDLRASQCRIARQRIERPHAPVTKAHKQRDDIGPLFTDLVEAHS